MFSIRPHNLTLGHLSQRNESLCSCRNMYMSVYSSFFHISQKLKTTQMSLNWWVVKQTGTSMPWATPKNKILIHSSEWFQENYAEWKKPFFKGHILYDSIFKSLKWWKYRNGNRLIVKELSLVWEGEKSGCGYKRTIWRIFMEMEMFYFLTLSMSISRLWYCTTVFKMFGENWVNNTGYLSVYALQLHRSYEKVVYCNFFR